MNKVLTNDVLHVQCWLNSLHEHQAYSTYFINQHSGLIDDELEDDILPVETMENALKASEIIGGNLMTLNI